MEQIQNEIQTHAEILETQMREESQLSLAMDRGDYAAMVSHKNNLESLKPLLLLSQISDAKSQLKQIEIDRQDIAKRKSELEEVLVERNLLAVKAQKEADDAILASRKLSVALYTEDAKDANLLSLRRDLNETISNIQKKIFAEGKGKEETQNN